MRDLRSHGGDCEDCCLLGCDALQCDKSVQALHRDHIPEGNRLHFKMSQHQLKIFM